MQPDQERAIAEFEDAQLEMMKAWALAASYLQELAERGDDDRATAYYALVEAAERRCQVARLDCMVVLP
jgi:hypothetical protein